MRLSVLVSPPRKVETSFVLKANGGGWEAANLELWKNVRDPHEPARIFE